MQLPPILSARVVQRYSHSNLILVEVTFGTTGFDLIQGNTVTIPVQDKEEDSPNEPHQLG